MSAAAGSGPAVAGAARPAGSGSARRAASTVAARWALALAILGALVAVSALLRTTAMRTSYWIDEGIAVGIAQFPLGDIPRALLQDGSPPLYYLLLHLWQTAFGTAESATRSLSLLASLLAIPLSWELARRIAGQRAAWITALLAAGHPFLTYYAQETRMYSLVSLEALLLSGSLVLLLTRGRRRWIVPAILSATALLYTHNWGLFVVAASALAALVIVLTGPPASRRRGIVDGLLVYCATGALYLPWVPSLLAQARSTGAPWSIRPGPAELFSAIVVPFGYEVTGVILAAIVAAAAVAIARRDRPGDAPTARAAVLLGVMLVLTGAIAWTASQLSPAWSVRYLAVSVGPAILLAGLVLARVPTVGAAVLTLLAVTWAQPLHDRIRQKGNVAQVAALTAQYGAVQPGNLLVSPHPEQIPVLRHYFGGELRYATSLGFHPDARIFDWRDALPRLEAARPGAVWPGLRQTLQPGQEVVLALPLLRSASWRAPWTSLVKQRSLEWEQMLDGDPALRRLGSLPRYGDRAVPRGVRVIVYRRR